MIYEKRVVSTTIWGIIFGFISWGLIGISGKVSLFGAIAIILWWSLLGFTVGISAWKIKWWLHGILLGLFFSIPAGFFCLWSKLDVGMGFVLPIILGIVFGLLIELLTTVVFKAEMREAKEKREEAKEE